MCGIAGIFHYQDFQRPVDRDLLLATTRTLAHRGPESGRGPAPPRPLDRAARGPGLGGLGRRQQVAEGDELALVAHAEVRAVDLDPKIGRASCRERV